MKTLTKLLEPFSKKKNIFSLIVGVFFFVLPFLRDSTTWFSWAILCATGIWTLTDIWIEKGSKLEKVIRWVFISILAVVLIVDIIIAFT